MTTSLMGQYSVLLMLFLIGVQWNGRGIMDERNRVWKSNAFSPVKKLITRTFPYEEPYLVITSRSLFHNYFTSFLIL